MFALWTSSALIRTVTHKFDYITAGQSPLTGLLLRHQNSIQSLTLHVLLFSHVPELDDSPTRVIVTNRRDAIFDICNVVRTKITGDKGR